MNITQYGSIVYIGIVMGVQHYKEISVFTFSFNSIDIKVENMSKSNCMQKIV